MTDPLSLNYIELWENGDPLNFAWAKYADEYQYTKYRNATSQGPLIALQQLLVDDLFVKLHEGTLIALGHRIAPDLSDGPIPIPKHCFAQRANLREVENDIISASGWNYERVRLAILNSIELLELQPPIPKNKISKKRGGGNTGNYENAKVIMAEMLALPAFRNMAAEPMRDAFNLRYISMYNTTERRTAGVSARALRNYLKRYRHELAETGND